MISGLFVDTAGWMSCADAADIAHTRSREGRDAALRAGRSLVTTDYIVDESLTLIRKRLGLAAAEAWWNQIEGTSRLRWEWIGPERSERARQLFFAFRDKDYSFTDCTSFVVMKELKLSEALTTDKHFRQMGFKVLPVIGRRRS